LGRKEVFSDTENCYCFCVDSDFIDQVQQLLGTKYQILSEQVAGLNLVQPPGELLAAFHAEFGTTAKRWTFLGQELAQDLEPTDETYLPLVEGAVFMTTEVLVFLAKDFLSYLNWSTITGYYLSPHDTVRRDRCGLETHGGDYNIMVLKGASPMTDLLHKFRIPRTREFPYELIDSLDKDAFLSKAQRPPDFRKQNLAQYYELDM